MKKRIKNVYGENGVAFWCFGTQRRHLLLAYGTTKTHDTFSLFTKVCALHLLSLSLSLTLSLPLWLYLHLSHSIANLEHCFNVGRCSSVFNFSQIHSNTISISLTLSLPYSSRLSAFHVPNLFCYHFLFHFILKLLLLNFLKQVSPPSKLVRKMNF